MNASLWKITAIDTFFLSSLPWWAWIGLVAIISGGVSGIVSMVLQHRERMAMIRMGMHPDQKGSCSSYTTEKPYHSDGTEL
jgi:hypothetical protein